MPTKTHAGLPWAALVGGIGWLVLLGLSAMGRAPLGRIENIFLLAPLVIVPLGLRVAAASQACHSSDSLYQLARLLQPFGASLAAASFFFEPGLRAALLASGWLAVCLAISLCGLLRIVKNGFESVGRLCSSMGLVYISIGGVGLVASRLGIELIGFKEPIVLLTAVHFHYAGFAAPLLVGATGQILNPFATVKQRILQFAAWGAIVAPALVAVGFIVSPLLKIFSSFLLAASLVGLSVLTLESLPLVKPGIARWLLGVSALSLPAAMMLVCVYAVGDFLGQELVSIPTMALFHGITNSVGFSLCGLLAWTLAARGESSVVASMPATSPIIPVEGQRA